MQLRSAQTAQLQIRGERHLPLPLSLQVYHRKIDDGPQASVALQHLQ